jgi:hypothetical protein
LISDAAIQQRQRAFQVPIYVSKSISTVCAGMAARRSVQSRRDAEQVLLAARTVYGRAWLGVNDDGGCQPVDSVATIRSTGQRPAMPARREALRPMRAQHSTK